MKSGFVIYGVIIFFLIISGCKKLEDEDIYRRPDWLEGKLYTQISLQDDISVFASALELTGLSDIIEKTGYFTVFAPTNSAFELYFQKHPEYGKDVGNIPKDELEKIIRFHIIQNGWTKNQLRSLDINGWIDPKDPNYNEPKGYKRETMLKDSIKKVWVYEKKGIYKIVNESASNKSMMVFPDSRKYAPFFYPEFFEINDYSSNDYEFYFERPYEGSGSIYYANALIISEEIPAENGFLYKIDRVVDPMLNMEQLLENDQGPYNYSKFLSLIYSYPEFNMDLDETFRQEGAAQGLAVDTLYRLTFPDLTFNINNEHTGPLSNYTIREHNTLLAPANEALQWLYDNIITRNSGYPHWPNIENIPLEIKKIIVNAHMSLETVYPREMSESFQNGEGDWITLDPQKIVQKEYGSNGVFLGLNEAIVPRAFQSITGPVYLRPGYSTFMYAMIYTNIMPALKRPDKEYSFFVLSDATLMNDSSLMLEWVDKDRNLYRFNVFDQMGNRMIRMRQNDLSRRLMNQIVLGRPRGMANKEWLENLAGNFIQFNNTNNTVQGAMPSVIGYYGDSVISVHPVRLEEPVDNGATFDVNAWFVNSESNIFSVVSNYSKFMELLDKTGLASKKSFKFNFLSEGEFYTVFAPTDEAFSSLDIDNMPLEELESLLRYHFIKGNLIFTDGSKPVGEYETMQIDSEASSEYVTVYSQMKIETGLDVIHILDKNGNTIESIEEEQSKNNIMAVYDIDASNISPFDFMTHAIVHTIDTVLINE